MFGMRLFLLLALMGGIIAFLGDHLGSKIGKKKMSLFGLRPRYTSMVMTVLAGVMIALFTLGVITLSSESARTALFGMEKLKSELAGLHQERDSAQAEVTKQKTKLAQVDKERASAEEKLDKVERNYSRTAQDLNTAKKQVEDLEAARNSLQTEVKSLEEATKRLKEGLVTLRKGDVVFRSGEVLFTGVLHSGLEDEDNKRQMNQFLTAANGRILQIMGVQENVTVLWVAERAVREALKVLQSSTGDIYVRICAAGNIVAGEMAVSHLEMLPNKKVYRAGTEILRQQVTVNVNSAEPDAALMAFLGEVNKLSVGAGVLPDPISGKVGQITASEMEDVSRNLRASGGKAEIIGRAKRDIYVSGPVLIDIEVKKR